ncbi:(d)CMP kinase [uncultured Pseudokineococcus sp.]|uniref:(d)CMP kinase n=1 Tax=uncultured Pseudokineococcus sp. TaxID=1642928 RepID=UPI00260A8DDB|nr:(d)CMP kinase [uncultured Pseudokineococcus sp.]
MPAPRPAAVDPAAVVPVVVAVDGPSGSGKSSVSRAVAARLGTAYLDTGATYRAVCWWCLEHDVDLDDRVAVAEAARQLDLQLGTDPADPSVHVEGRLVTDDLRASRVSSAVSAVATNLDVRAELRRRQREVVDRARQERGVVAEGRDTTTVVVPDADVRVLLVADEEARLRRRARDVHGSDDDAARERTRDEVLRRDRDDSTVSEFSVAADGVVTVDSSELTLEETVEAVLALVARAVPGAVPAGLAPERVVERAARAGAR